MKKSLKNKRKSMKQKYKNWIQATRKKSWMK